MLHNWCERDVDGGGGWRTYVGVGGGYDIIMGFIALQGTKSITSFEDEVTLDDIDSAEHLDPVAGSCVP